MYARDENLYNFVQLTRGIKNCVIIQTGDSKYLKDGFAGCLISYIIYLSLFFIIF